MARADLIPPRQIEWTVQQLDAFKAKAKAQILDWRKSLSPAAALKKILKEVQVYKEAGDSDGQLWCFIYCISALVHQELYGGLNDKQIDNVFLLAEGILRVRRVQPKRSRLASMYGDLYTIRSQIYRRQGDHWSAAWEQHLESRYGGGRPNKGKTFHDLAMGNRLARIGFKRLSLSYFAAVQAAPSDQQISKDQTIRMNLIQITLLRICNDTEIAQALLQDLKTKCDSRSKFSLDIEWEQLCCTVQVQQSVRDLVAVTAKGQSHYTAGYIVEQALWGLCMPKREALKEIAVLESLKRNKAMQLKGLGHFYPIALAIQEGYDHTIPIETRLRNLSHWLRKAPELISIDKELLIWLAAARCLVRIRSHELAVLCLGKYESLSRQISEGATTDGLNLAYDLLEAEWYKFPERAEQPSGDLDAGDFQERFIGEPKGIRIA